MSKESTFFFKPPMTGKEIAASLMALAQENRANRLGPLERKTLEQLEHLTATLKKTMHELGGGIGRDLEVVIDRYLDLKRLANASLTTGLGQERLRDVLDQLKVQIDREIQRNAEFGKDPRVAQLTMQISVLLAQLGEWLFEEFAEARKQKDVMQHEFKHIKGVLDSVGDEKNQTELLEVTIFTEKELENWFRSLREAFLDPGNPLVDIKEQYRGTYIKSWDRFLSKVAPKYAEEDFSKKSWGGAAAKYEKLFDELMTREFLTHTLKNLNGWKWDLQPGPITENQKVHRPDARLSKRDVNIDIEFKVTGDQYEIWFEVPDKYRQQVPMALADLLFNLRDAKLDQGISIRGEKSVRSGSEAIVLAVPSEVDRGTFTRLQEFAIKELGRLFP